MSQIEVIDPIGEGFRTYLLKLEGGDIAASARTSRAPTGGRLVSDVWTDPKHRGKGYSKNVLNAIFNAEPRPLKLRVGAYGDGKKMSNEQLKKYYERLGFTKPEGDLLVKAAMRVLARRTPAGTFDGTDFVEHLLPHDVQVDKQAGRLPWQPPLPVGPVNDQPITQLPWWKARPGEPTLGDVADSVAAAGRKTVQVVRNAMPKFPETRMVRGPYTPNSNRVDSVMIPQVPTLNKQSVVRRKGKKWQLWTADGSRVLGTHDSAQDAYKQEYAIQKSKERAAKAASLADQAAGALPQLMEAKRESDRKNYKRKHTILRRLIEQNPEAFSIDSMTRGIVGITHNPTGFRLHMPGAAVPSLLQMGKNAAAVERVPPSKRKRQLPWWMVPMGTMAAGYGALRGTDWLVPPKSYGAIKPFADAMMGTPDMPRGNDMALQDAVKFGDDYLILGNRAVSTNVLGGQDIPSVVHAVREQGPRVGKWLNEHPRISGVLPPQVPQMLSSLNPVSNEGELRHYREFQRGPLSAYHFSLNEYDPGQGGTFGEMLGNFSGKAGVPMVTAGDSSAIRAALRDYVNMHHRGPDNLDPVEIASLSPERQTELLHDFRRYLMVKDPEMFKKEQALSAAIGAHRASTVGKEYGTLSRAGVNIRRAGLILGGLLMAGGGYMAVRKVRQMMARRDEERKKKAKPQLRLFPPASAMPVKAAGASTNAPGPMPVPMNAGDWEIPRIVKTIASLIPPRPVDAPAGTFGAPPGYATQAVARVQANMPVGTGWLTSGHTQNFMKHYSTLVPPLQRQVDQSVGKAVRAYNGNPIPPLDFAMRARESYPAALTHDRVGAVYEKDPIAAARMANGLFQASRTPPPVRVAPRPQSMLTKSNAWWMTRPAVDKGVKYAQSDADGWHGVDLDGTLANYEGWKGHMFIGRPIPRMVNRVKAWLDKGEKVKIFTTRANNGPMAIERIKRWCRKHLGQELEVTSVKDEKMIDIWDDRAHGVECNTGIKRAEAGAFKRVEGNPCAYGYCPQCGARGVSRERRVDGNDTCANGHVYPSNAADRVGEIKEALSHAEVVEAGKVVPKKLSLRRRASGNYRKGVVTWNGLRISIETPAGHWRIGKKEDGKLWFMKMRDAYGYIQRHEGYDGDAVDVFLGPDLDSPWVHVVNQTNGRSSEFDEVKVVIGCHTEAEARLLYMRNYTKGWTGYRSCVRMSVEQFKNWLPKAKDGPARPGDVAKAAAFLAPLAISTAGLGTDLITNAYSRRAADRMARAMGPMPHEEKALLDLQTRLRAVPVKGLRSPAYISYRDIENRVGVPIGSREPEEERRKGIVVYDPKNTPTAYYAHELGHADVPRWARSDRFTPRALTAANVFSYFPGAAYGAWSGRPIAGAAVGALGRLIGRSPVIVEEYFAMRRANQMIDALPGTPEDKQAHKAALMRAFLTYVIPPVASGAAVGGVAGLAGMLKSK